MLGRCKYNEGLLCQNLLEDYSKCCSNINLMRTIPKLYKMLHFWIQNLECFDFAFLKLKFLTYCCQTKKSLKPVVLLQSQALKN